MSLQRLRACGSQSECLVLGPKREQASRDHSVARDQSWRPTKVFLGAGGRAPLLIRSSKVPATAGNDKTDTRSIGASRVMAPRLDLPQCKPVESMESSRGMRSPLRRLVVTMLIARNSNLLPSTPLNAPLGQVLPLRNQILMDGAGEQGDAVPATPPPIASDRPYAHSRGARP